jgi:hypothetical protein
VIRAISSASHYPDPGWWVWSLREQGYEVLREEDVILVLCDTTDDPDSEEADLFLQELHLDAPGFVLDEVLGDAKGGAR